ncbi:MAG: hypothetical protein ACTXOO_04020 [Sodalis sp. (in: enterobacteria)]
MPVSGRRSATDCGAGNYSFRASRLDVFGSSDTVDHIIATTAGLTLRHCRNVGSASHQIFDKITVGKVDNLITAPSLAR